MIPYVTGPERAPGVSRAAVKERKENVLFQDSTYDTWMEKKFKMDSEGSGFNAQRADRAAVTCFQNNNAVDSGKREP